MCVGLSGASSVYVFVHCLCIVSHNAHVYIISCSACLIHVNSIIFVTLIIFWGDKFAPTGGG